MNERIRELWTQGTFNVVPRTGDYSSVSVEQIEKFAELIVRECARWLGNREFASPEALKQHFGVKE